MQMYKSFLRLALLCAFGEAPGEVLEKLFGFFFLWTLQWDMKKLSPMLQKAVGGFQKPVGSSFKKTMTAFKTQQQLLGNHSLL